MKRYSNFHGSMSENKHGAWVDISDALALESQLSDALTLLQDQAAEIERLKTENRQQKLALDMADARINHMVARCKC
jgi:hypothetical protein